MKTLALPLAVILTVAMLIAGQAAVTPDFAIQSEAWDLDADTYMWDVRVCAIIVYFAGPLAVEDRTDCGLPLTVVAR